MFKRINDGIARGEAAVAVGMLLLMILVAFLQAFLRNLTNMGIGWANAGLSMIDWADEVLSKGTLWLAFLGASLAVYDDKHVAIDVLPKLVSPRLRMLMRIGVGITGTVACYFLMRAFWSAVMINAEERPSVYEVLSDTGTLHVCDASAAQLEGGGQHAPGGFCALRSVIRVFGVTVETPAATYQLLVPIMFGFMCVRYFAYAIRDIGKFSRGEFEGEEQHGLPAAAAEVAHDIDDRKGGR